MTTLVLMLTGPLQSWGERSSFSTRLSNSYPTRSGIVGLLASALGYPRSHPLDWSRELGIAVRCDRPGSPLIDFHTVGGGLPAKFTIPTSDGGRRPPGKGTLVSNRHYLSDAAFVATVETASEDQADLLAGALLRPRWPPFLGRRSCPPSLPIYLGRTGRPGLDVLMSLPLHRASARQDEVTVPIISDAPSQSDGFTTVNDQPVSYHPYRRNYQPRLVTRDETLFNPHLCVGAGLAGFQKIVAALEDMS